MKTRSHRIRCIAVAACAAPLLLAGAGAAGAVTTAAHPAAQGVVQQASASEILSLVNAEREKAGCQPLAENAQLTKAAQDHAADMAKNNLTGHTGSNGSTVPQRIEEAGYTWGSWGENVSGPGYDTAKAHVDGWLNSPAHKADMLRCSYTETGVAVSGDRAVQVFATPR